MSLSIKVVKNLPDLLPNTLPPKTSGYKPRRKYNWDALRQDFIRENLQPGSIKGMSLMGFSEKHGISYNSVNMQAQIGGWEVAVLELREEMAEQTSRQLIANSGVSEMEIRTKQAKYAALAINKAILKLMTVNPEDLSVKDATKLLQMGLTEERRALGLVESVSMVKTDANPQQEKVSAASKALAILERRRTLNRLEQGIMDVVITEVVEALPAGTPR